jgi:acyl-CoA dehydrogenase
MRLIPDEQQSLLAQNAREFFRTHNSIARLRALRDTRDAVGFSRELWQRMAELGWVGLCLPEEYAGLGLGLSELCIVLEEAGRRLAPEPFVSTVLLGAQALMLGGSATQKAHWLPRVAAGEALLALAYQERGSRHEFARSEAWAETVPGGFRLTGEKLQVLDAHVADALLVLARSQHGSSLFLVDPSAAGVSITRQLRIDSRNAAIVRLDGVEVAADALVGGAKDGGALLRQVVDRATIGLAAEQLGSASQAFEDTIEYLKTRQQFGVSIGSFQALQHRAARLFIELSLARSALAAAARTADAQPMAADVPDLQAQQLAKAASLAKARCSEVFLHVANEAIQMHGGIGVTDEHQLGFYLKRARAADVTFGDATWHCRRWAELGGY